MYCLMYLYIHTYPTCLHLQEKQFTPNHKIKQQIILWEEGKRVEMMGIKARVL